MWSRSNDNQWRNNPAVTVWQMQWKDRWGSTYGHVLIHMILHDKVASRKASLSQLTALLLLESFTENLWNVQRFGFYWTLQTTVNSRFLLPNVHLQISQKGEWDHSRSKHAINPWNCEIFNPICQELLSNKEKTNGGFYDFKPNKDKLKGFVLF